MAKTRVDKVLSQWIGSCPGCVYGNTETECFEYVQYIIGDAYELDEIQASLNRLGYIPNYRTRNEGDSYYCLQLPDPDWRGRR